MLHKPGFKGLTFKTRFFLFHSCILACITAIFSSTSICKYWIFCIMICIWWPFTSCYTRWLSTIWKAGVVLYLLWSTGCESTYNSRFSCQEHSKETDCDFSGLLSLWATDCKILNNSHGYLFCQKQLQKKMVKNVFSLECWQHKEDTNVLTLYA